VAASPNSINWLPSAKVTVFCDVGTVFQKYYFAEYQVLDNNKISFLLSATN
jgi:hypothetical protein